MQTYETLKQTIIEKSKEHLCCKEEFEYEAIEAEVIRKLYFFAKQEGTIFKEEQYDDALALFECFDKMLELDSLTPQVKVLYKLMLKVFWDMEV